MTTFYQAQLHIDLSSTPTSVIHSASQFIFATKEECQAECDKLNTDVDFASNDPDDEDNDDCDGEFDGFDVTARPSWSVAILTVK